MKKKAALSGFSIIEFMIAIALGGMIIATAAAVFQSNKSSYRVQEELSRLQENGRYANYFLDSQLRMAGFQGCTNDNAVTLTNLIKNPSVALSKTTAINGYDGLASSYTPSLPSNLQSKTKANSDVIELRMAANNNLQLSADMGTANADIAVYSRNGIKAGEPMIISNCNMGDIFIASGTNNSSIGHNATDNSSANLSTSYKSSAHLMRYLYYAYYVKNTGRSNASNQPVYALVRQDLNGNEIELVEGVEQLKISYGVDSNNDLSTDQYQTANQVNAANNWPNVISIKINLLLSTNEDVSSSYENYKFNGSVYTATDRKLRREWETYVNLRNRGFPS